MNFKFSEPSLFLKYICTQKFINYIIINLFIVTSHHLHYAKLETSLNVKSLGI